MRFRDSILVKSICYTACLVGVAGLVTAIWLYIMRDNPLIGVLYAIGTNVLLWWLVYDFMTDKFVRKYIKILSDKFVQKSTVDKSVHRRFGFLRWTKVSTVDWELLYRNEKVFRDLALENVRLAAKVRLMESSLNFNRLRESNVRRCEEVFHKLDGADADADTAENRHWLKVNIAHELADLVIYADLLAARLDIDLGEAIKFKFNEVSDKRKSTVKL